jgi:transposase
MPRPLWWSTRLSRPPRSRSFRIVACFVPSFAGAFLSDDSKDALWDRFYTGSATTTEAVSRAIQHSQESLRALAKRYGVNPKTIAKWKARTSVSDLPTGPSKPRSPVLSVEEEAVVVAFRRHTLLPLDDYLYALQPTIPHLTRSSLHRCLQRHGITRLPQVEGEASPKRKFKAYPIGYFHLDIAEVRTAQGKLYLLIAIDRTSKFAFVELHEKVARRTAGDFLRRLIAAVPYKVDTVLTDNGTHFTTPGNTSSAAPDVKAALDAGQPVWAHAFEYACAQNDIDHRLTQVQASLDQWASRENEPDQQGRHRQTILLRNSRPAANPPARLRRRL